MMPETLLAAAARLRELDANATQGPWRPGQLVIAHDHERGDADLIATMRGLTGPIAGWLEGIAGRYINADGAELNPALAVARAVLGREE